MANYSFRCKKCGFYVSDDDKGEVIKIKKKHKKYWCPVALTAHNTIARPEVAKQINDEEGAIIL